MKRTLTLLFASLGALAVALATFPAEADNTTGYWTKPTSCTAGTRCIAASFPATGAVVPNDRQPDGGIIGAAKNADGGVLPNVTGLGPQAGLDLAGLKGFTVTVEVDVDWPSLDAGGYLTSGGALQAYIYSLAAQRWSRAPDLDLSLSTASLASVSYYGFLVTADMGRVAFVPSGLGQPTNVYLSGR